MFPGLGLQTSLSNPYILADVRKSDFDRLLATLYPRALGVEEAETTHDWISILGLASKWGFNSLRSRAISKIEQSLDSPIDMVILGRQYSIPDVLLPGYAVLCQSTTPLSYKEALRLGVEDVVNIYRIRHELYGSGITPVSLEEAFMKVKEAGLVTERPREGPESEQASTWTDVGSVAASQTPTEEERRTVTFTPHVNALLLEDASTDVNASTSERLGQRPSNESTSDNEGSDAPSSVIPVEVPDRTSVALWSAKEGPRLVEELTIRNFSVGSVEIMRWINTKDMQTLHQITQMIVEKAIEHPDRSYPCARLCKAMIKYTQTLHQITRLVVKKAIEEPSQMDACVRLCGMISKEASGTVTTDGLLFRDYLGDICQENLETVAASVAAADDYMARVQRLHLVDFVGELANWYVIDPQKPAAIEKWVTALLDVNDEEKVTTLCMVMSRVGHLCPSDYTDGWFSRAANVARETNKPRVRTLLQGVERGWFTAGPDEDCTVQ